MGGPTTTPTIATPNDRYVRPAQKGLLASSSVPRNRVTRSSDEPIPAAPIPVVITPVRTFFVALSQRHSNSSEVKLLMSVTPQDL